MNKSRQTLYRLAGAGLMAALVFVSSYIQIPVPLPVGNTRIHLGNVFCLLSGLLLGAVPGGLAAGIGSVFFDLTNPLYVAYAPFTFAFKFLMAAVAGAIAKKQVGTLRPRVFLGAAAGGVLYVVLHVSRVFLEAVFFSKTELETAAAAAGASLVVSLVNAGLAVVIAVPLSAALFSALVRSGIWKQLNE